jgi:hypothetical protein
VPQDGRGSLSTIGYWRISGERVIRPGMSSQPKRQSAKYGTTSDSSPSRVQSGRTGGSEPPTMTSATQLISTFPPGARAIG